MQDTFETRVWSLGQEDPLEERMATHSSILAWRISWTEEPGRLQSMVSQRVGHDWSDVAHTCIVAQEGDKHNFEIYYLICSLCMCCCIHKSKFIFLQSRKLNHILNLKWQPTPVFLPGESHGQRSLVGYSPWGRKELDTTEWLHFTSVQ